MSFKLPKTVQGIQTLISGILQHDRLTSLAQSHPILAMAYMEIILHTNYHLLATEETKLYGGFFGIGAKTFDYSISGKINGIAHSFAHAAGKLDNLLSVEAVEKITPLITGMSNVLVDVAQELSKRKDTA